MNESQLRRPRGFLAGTVTAIVGLVAASVFYAPAGAQEITSFEARAVAEGGRFTFGAPNFVAVDTFIDGGGPVSQSILDGLGNSQSFASLPYPSDNAISGPSTVAGLAGLPSPPAYPFYVSTRFPTQEEASFTQPGIDLQARSGENSSEATATSGGGSGESSVGLVRTHTLAQRDGNQVVAEATANADIVNIGGVLRILGGVARAKVTRGPDGEPQRESELSISAVSIADQSVGFTSEGFVAGPGGAPIPADNPLVDALEQAGITVEYLAPTETENGIVSPGLIITQQQEIPSGPTLVVRYIIGRALAEVTVT